VSGEALALATVAFSSGLLTGWAIGGWFARKLSGTAVTILVQQPPVEQHDPDAIDWSKIGG
jgi:hypothetical protein